MDFRKATIDDIPSLIEMRKQQLLDEGFNPVTNIDLELKEYFLRTLSDGSFISWLAIDQSTIVATSGLCFYQLPPSYSNPTGQVAYVTNMFTKREYRRQGISTHLLSLTLDEAKRRNYKVIRLHASADGKPIYTKAGFIDSDGYMSLKFPYS
jgi:GNAT superfamily N-acetyltransferase